MPGVRWVLWIGGCGGWGVWGFRVRVSGLGLVLADLLCGAGFAMLDCTVIVG